MDAQLPGAGERERNQNSRKLRRKRPRWNGRFRRPVYPSKPWGPVYCLSSKEPSSMQSLAKPTFVLVPGLAHGPVHFQSLVESLHAKGYPTESISHPTVGPLAVTAPPNADAENLRRVLEELINDQQKDVILFCHSYGGFVGSQVKGFEQSARVKAGQKGGIVKVICLSANLPREGESMMQILTELAIVPRQWMQLDVSCPCRFPKGRGLTLRSSPRTGRSSLTPRPPKPYITICRMTRLSTGRLNLNLCPRVWPLQLRPTYAGTRTFQRCTYSAKKIAHLNSKDNSGC